MLRWSRTEPRPVSEHHARTVRAVKVMASCTAPTREILRLFNKVREAAGDSFMLRPAERLVSKRGRSTVDSCNNPLRSIEMMVTAGSLHALPRLKSVTVAQLGGFQGRLRTVTV